MELTSSSETFPNERPKWCPHIDCQFCRRAQDSICVGVLPEPVPHEGDVNIYRLCLRMGVEIFNLQMNDSDIYHFGRLFKALQEV